MPYGKTQAEWNALPQAERSALAGGGSGTPTQQANQRLATEGRPGQFTTAGSYQVLGGPRSAPPSPGASAQAKFLSALGLGGGGAAGPASGAAAYAGGAAPALGPLGGGGGAGGTTGAGRPVAAYTPPPQAAQMTAQQNPYIKQLMELSLGQFAKPLDFKAERANLREEGTRQQLEARQMAGARGGQGQWGAQQQDLANTALRGLTGHEAGFGDRETQARRALLGTMSGIGGEGTRDIASQLAAQQAQADLMQRYDAAAKDYDIRRQQVADQGLNSRMSAISTLFGLI